MEFQCLEYKDAVKLGEFYSWLEIIYNFFNPVCLISSANVCLCVFHCLCCMSGCHYCISILSNADWCVMYLTEHEINILPSSALLPQFSCPSYSLFLPLLEGPLLAMLCNCHCVKGVTHQEILFANISWGLWPLLAKASLDRGPLITSLAAAREFWQAILPLPILLWLEKL